MCQKLCKLAGSRQSYCKNKQAYFFGPPCRFGFCYAVTRVMMYTVVMLVAIHDRSDNQGTSNQSFAEHTLYLERHQVQITTANNPLHDSNGRRQRTLQVNLTAKYRYLFTSPFVYGLTFCLFMGTLYDTSLGPTLFFQTYTIRQLDLTPKSWNELLRH